MAIGRNKTMRAKRNIAQFFKKRLMTFRKTIIPRKNKKSKTHKKSKCNTYMCHKKSKCHTNTCHKKHKKHKKHKRQNGGG